MKSLKQRIKNNELTVGTWMSLPSPAIAEIMSKQKFDWVCVDLEHSAITFSQAEDLIRIIDLSGNTPLVRVGHNDPLIIKRVMDAGAHGVIVPMVNSREEAMQAVESVKYPPEGKRGVGLSRAQRHGLGFEAYKKWLAKESVVIVQIEHIEAIHHLEEILSVPGVDGSLIGPYDLSASMGFPGGFDRKDVKETVARYLKVCKTMKKLPGYHVIPPDNKIVKEKVRQGFRFVAFSIDALILSRKIQDELQHIKG